MLRFAFNLVARPKLSAGIHTSSARSAISKFSLPALSPTMTEGTIHKWKKQEGESFIAGDVLLELETDKAQMDVEAQEDGVLAKIILPEGKKAAVNTTIALLAEEGDDISNVTYQEENEQPAASTDSGSTTPSQPATSLPKKPVPSAVGHDHKLDTSQLKKPLSPAVLSLVHKYGITDLGAIKASGPGGRILKGDVLGHLGMIEYRPAPKQTLSAAPPRDQIVIVKPESSDKDSKKKEKKESLPTFITKRVVLQQGHPAQAETIQHAVQRALSDMKHIRYGPAAVTAPTAVPVADGSFKIFHLGEPDYDVISDSYEPAKPFVLKVGKASSTTPLPQANDEVMDAIAYLGGESLAKTQRSSSVEKMQSIELELEGGVPGRVQRERGTTQFLDRVEFYLSPQSALHTA